MSWIHHLRALEVAAVPIEDVAVSSSGALLAVLRDQGQVELWAALPALHHLFVRPPFLSYSF